jgi:hypothetical protein
MVDSKSRQVGDEEEVIKELNSTRFAMVLEGRELRAPICDMALVKFQWTSTVEVWSDMRRVGRTLTLLFQRR